ncbi:MAG: hypothetical protein EOP85_04790 [Verrucomicrobiaceae bacterium]|nr:MAG: hypothetical protein EOP85_04790 [Verrucomicrobiaceae bacterium]
MKKTLLPSVVAMAILAGNASALTPITDAFNKLSETTWYQYKTGKGKLAASGKLSFITKGAPTKYDFSSIELLTSRPGFNEDWQLTLDLTNTANSKTDAGGGLMIFNVQDRSDYLYLEYYGTSGVDGGIIVNGKPPAKKGHISIPAATKKGSVKITFDKKKKLLSLALSVKNKKQGYEWVDVGNFSPTGKGGDVSGNWDMNAAGGTFGIQLFGVAFDTAVKTGKITFDNFQLSAP